MTESDTEETPKGVENVFPTSRIKKLMKMDETVGIVSADAVALVSQATVSFCSCTRKIYS